MGKINQDSDDDAMDIEVPQQQPTTVLKRKTIKKKEQKAAPTQATKVSATTSGKRKQTLDKTIKKIAKEVNLPRRNITFQEKQQIYHQAVREMKKKDKVPRKDRKKLRVTMKKNLRQELEEKLPTKAQHEKTEAEAMAEEKQHAVRKQKFDEVKEVNNFKKNMGLTFSNLKKLMMQNRSS